MLFTCSKTRQEKTRNQKNLEKPAKLKAPVTRTAPKRVLLCKNRGGSVNSLRKK